MIVSPPFFLFCFSQLSKTDAICENARLMLGGNSWIPQD
jgi:hypothetical protein